MPGERGLELRNKRIAQHSRLLHLNLVSPGEKVPRKLQHSARAEANHHRTMRVLLDDLVRVENQRGITHQMLEDLLACADVEAPIGRGCTVLRVSRARLRDRTLKAQVATRPEKLASLAVVWSHDSGEVFTLLVDHGGSKGRRYRARH